MSYYVLKHSAKGTTWSDHKYIRKEGSRYVYPEDVEGTKEERLKNAVVGPDGDKKAGFAYNYLKLIDPEAAEKYLNEDVEEYREKLKNIDDVELVKMLQRLNKLEKMNDNRPPSEMDKSTKAAINIDNIKNAIKVELDDRRKRNKILSEAKTAADEHKAKEEHDSRAAQAAAEKEAHLANAKKKDTLSKTDPRFANRTDTLSKSDSRFKVKKKSDPANKYRIISKSKKYYEYGADAKTVKESDRVIEIAKRRRGIKDKDKLASRATAKYIKRTRHKYK